MSSAARRRGVVLAAAGLLSVGVITAPRAQADAVVVFAAASLATALAEIETGFEAATGHDLVVSAGGSSALARQIQQGAPADVFISASPDWMDVLVADGLIADGTRFDLLGNRLVLVAFGTGAAPVTIGAELDLAGLIGDGRLAMALVDSVPAGIYGKAALDRLGLWDGIEARVAQADNVRAALAFVATGEAPFGIVYGTDAAASDAVTIVGTFPADTHPPIVYPVAALAGRASPATIAFLDHLRGPAARAAFVRQGFTVLEP